MFYPIRENGSCDRTGDSAAGDRSERGAFSLPESPDRTPSPRGEIRRPEGGDGVLGERHVHAVDSHSHHFDASQLNLKTLCLGSY